MRLLYVATACALLLLTSVCVNAEEAKDIKSEPRVYEGPWKTTNRKLDGIMTAVVTEVGQEKWKGRFYGIWQGVPFDYTVNFEGPAGELRGTAVIDHADYTWKGAMTDEPQRFTGSFGGSRYAGYFDLKAKDKPAAVSRTVTATRER